MDTGTDKIAIWVVTPNGMAQALRLYAVLPETALFYTERLKAQVDPVAHGTCVQRLTRDIAKYFDQFTGHVFIMSTGIVVRAIAPLLKNKIVDPAVVVVDDNGRFAISLISGHIGGANRLASDVAGILEATPVITTATDVNHKPAIDVLAREKQLKIENPRAIKWVNMAFLLDEPVRVHDPMNRLGRDLPDVAPLDLQTIVSTPVAPVDQMAAVYIDDVVGDLPPYVLVLRPPSLVAGIGCNRNTPKTEIRTFFFQVLKQFSLSPDSVGAIASIDLKSDESGLVDLAVDLNVPLKFFSRDELNQVKDVPTPSAMVAKHVGVKSVCEASAILASQNGQLIVPKQNNHNVTVAIARRAFISSESDPAR